MTKTTQADKLIEERKEHKSKCVENKVAKCVKCLCLESNAKTLAEAYEEFSETLKTLYCDLTHNQVMRVSSLTIISKEISFLEAELKKLNEMNK